MAGKFGRIRTVAVCLGESSGWMDVFDWKNCSVWGSDIARTNCGDHTFKKGTQIVGTAKL